MPRYPHLPVHSVYAPRLPPLNTHLSNASFHHLHLKTPNTLSPTTPHCPPTMQRPLASRNTPPAVPCPYTPSTSIPTPHATPEIHTARSKHTPGSSLSRHSARPRPRGGGPGARSPRSSSGSARQRGAGRRRWLRSRRCGRGAWRSGCGGR